ncbi:MAG: hypothetical protein Q8L56_06655 [Rhodocyclaceae bacterium]|nr:hypothetical protein [Rhodocyclaceae bacterium]
MNGPTPDQLRNIDNLVKLFDKDWFADTSTKEIRRKPIKGWRRVLDVIWKQKHTVFAMYWWIKHNWASERLIVHHYPMRSDNMPIKGFPVKCELQGGWTIPKADLKYLTHGPLASEGLHEIIVPASHGWRYAFEVFKQFAPVVSIAAGAVTIGTNWATVTALYQWATNAF